MRRLAWMMLGCAALVFCLVPASAYGERTFVGAEKCKMCHKIQYESWAKTPHAKALDALKPEDRAKAECIGCHTTNGVELPNVQCEACHGAGSEYKTLAIMKDKEKAIAAGLTIPDETLCAGKCHNSKSPNFKSFDFKTMAPKVHEHKTPAK